MPPKRKVAAMTAAQPSQDTPDPTLDQCLQFVADLKATNSNLEKKEICGKHPHLRKLLRYVYHPHWNYNITKAQYLKQVDNKNLPSVSPAESLFALLDQLKSGIRGLQSVALIKAFIHAVGNKYQNLILSAVNKDLEIRVNAKEINKVFPETIPEFNVALAQAFEGDIDTDLPKGKWYISHKLDGLRALFVITGGHGKAYSRQGNEFPRLQPIADILANIPQLQESVLDGEACVMKDGKEDFKLSVSEIKRKTVKAGEPEPDFRFHVFDLLTYQEFMSASSVSTLSERLTRLSQIDQALFKGKVAIVEQELMVDKSTFDKWNQRVKEGGWEGLMLRADVGYKGKRSKDLLKVKPFEDGEWRVHQLLEGEKHVLVNGIATKVKMLAAVMINVDGVDVKVGSGFSDAERVDFLANPQKILNKLITVQYQEKIVDSGSLRFPTFKAVRDYE